MPRDASATRDSLVDAGRELFAKEGVYSVALSRVVAHAGQKNESALHYHFGGRQGLLDAIIDAHNEPIEDRRRLTLDHLDAEPQPTEITLDDLVRAYVEPQAELLAISGGRRFLSIISQLHDLFDRWNDPGAPAQARRVLESISRSLELTTDLRHERITRFLGFVALTLGSRARSIERGLVQPLGHDEFVANLVAMSVGALSA
jgi:AcrR family transcriptional regulator